MEDLNSDVEYAGLLLDCLNDETMPLVDFDEMKEWIGRQQNLLKTFEEARIELEILRDDYQKRIAGMVKAIAVTDRHRDRYQAALQLVDELQSMSGEDLINCYRRTSARFRDMFPTSLGGTLARAGRSGRKSDLSVYK